MPSKLFASFWANIGAQLPQIQPGFLRPALATNEFEARSVRRAFAGLKPCAYFFMPTKLFWMLETSWQTLWAVNSLAMVTKTH
jgi:hypothetical protein